jgi:hypothetical protein
VIFAAVSQIQNTMKINLLIMGVVVTAMGCSSPKANEEAEKTRNTEFEVVADRFADLQVLRYEIP